MTRPVRRWVFLAVVTSLVLAPVAGAQAPRASVPQAAAQGREEAALRQLVAEQTEAWNRGDAVAWSKDFAPEARFINIAGMAFNGRQEIEQRHAAIFASFFKGSRSQVTVQTVRFLGPEVAVVDTEHEVTGYQGLPPGIRATDTSGALRTRMRYVLNKVSKKWQIVAGQNTAILPPPEKK